MVTAAFALSRNDLQAIIDDLTNLILSPISEVKVAFDRGLAAVSSQPAASQVRQGCGSDHLLDRIDGTDTLPG